MKTIRTNNRFFDVSIFSFFLFLHLFLFNVNSAEWGDSYRILRASEFVRMDLSYPEDEKRPPLFSALLAIRPEFLDPVVSSKVWMLLVSLGSLLLFKKLVESVFENTASRFLSLLLFILNPVYLYWSIRIYADVFFSLLVLAALVYFATRVTKRGVVLGADVLFLSVVTGLSILTRFEGYLLLGSVFGGLFFVKNSQVGVIRRVRTCLLFVLMTLVLILPYLLHSNPFSSSYFSEPSGRSYDLFMLLTYITSLFFAFGFVFTGYFILSSSKLIRVFVAKNSSIGFFIAFSLILALLWPAAIPRLFVPVVPFLIIFVVIGIEDFFVKQKSPTARDLLAFFALIAFYAVGQFVVKQQFLITIKPVFILLLALQFLMALFLYKRSYANFVLSLFFSLVIWSLTIIWMHRDIYRSTKEASLYALENLCGRVVHNDTASIVDWYLNHSSGGKCLYSTRVDLVDLKDPSVDLLKDRDFEYIIFTNEHNPSISEEIFSDNIIEITNFTHFANGRQFFTKIIKIEKKGIIDQI